MFFRPVLLSLAASAVLALAGFVPEARAEDAPRITGVVELFTSQSCNSCPPADRVLAELGARPDIVVLSYHVDYWDYLGWQDTLGTAENSARQRLYMRAMKSRSVYTPQAVVNGHVQMVGADRNGLVRALKEMALAGAGAAVPLTVSRREGGFAVEAGEAPADRGAGAAEAALLLVAFGAPAPMRIPSGENAGRTITYWNPVASVRPLGVWRRAKARFEVPADAMADGQGAAVLLQVVDGEGLPGPILGAAVIRRPGEP